MPPRAAISRTPIVDSPASVMPPNRVTSERTSTYRPESSTPRCRNSAAAEPTVSTTPSGVAGDAQRAATDRRGPGGGGSEEVLVAGRGHRLQSLWLAPVPPAAARRLLTHPRVEPLVSTALLARLVANPARFALAELAGRGRVVTHRVRRGGAIVLLEHGTPDVQSFDELFYQQIYAPPPEVDAAARGTRPRADASSTWAPTSASSVRGRSPAGPARRSRRSSPTRATPRCTAGRSRRTAAAPRWRLHEAAATVADGEMRFLTGRYAMSGPATDADADAASVPARDVLPLLGMGGPRQDRRRGQRVGDPRRPALRRHHRARPRARVPPGPLPGRRARTAAVRRLRGAGFAAPRRADASAAGLRLAVGVAEIGGAGR